MGGRSICSKAVGTLPSLGHSQDRRDLKPWSSALRPSPSPPLYPSHSLGRWSYRQDGTQQVGIPKPRYLSWKYFPLYLHTPILFLFSFCFYNARLKSVFSSNFLYLKMLPLDVNCAVVRGWGWVVETGRRGEGSPVCRALQARAMILGCLRFPSRLQSQAWSQIYSPSASSDGIPRSYHQLVKRNHSENCKLASKNCKDSFTRKLTPANVI